MGWSEQDAGWAQSTVVDIFICADVPSTGNNWFSLDMSDVPVLATAKNQDEEVGYLKFVIFFCTRVKCCWFTKMSAPDHIFVVMVTGWGVSCSIIRRVRMKQNRPGIDVFFQIKDLFALEPLQRMFPSVTLTNLTLVHCGYHSWWLPQSLHQNMKNPKHTLATRIFQICYLFSHFPE